MSLVSHLKDPFLSLLLGLYELFLKIQCPGLRLGGGGESGIASRFFMVGLSLQVHLGPHRNQMGFGLNALPAPFDPASGSLGPFP